MMIRPDSHDSYVVSNTFSEKHAYVAYDQQSARPVHVTEKRFYVSFFPVKGEYRLSFRHDDERIQVMVGYSIDKKPALLAILRGAVKPLSSHNILSYLCWYFQWPMRPFVSIHVEALKLWRKRVRYFKRPDAPKQQWSKTILEKNKPR